MSDKEHTPEEKKPSEKSSSAEQAAKKEQSKSKSSSKPDEPNKPKAPALKPNQKVKLLKGYPANRSGENGVPHRHVPPGEYTVAQVRDNGNDVCLNVPDWIYGVDVKLADVKAL